MLEAKKAGNEKQEAGHEGGHQTCVRRKGRGRPPPSRPGGVREGSERGQEGGEGWLEGGERGQERGERGSEGGKRGFG